jgi:hypothetical protein
MVGMTLRRFLITGGSQGIGAVQAFCRARRGGVSA